MERKEFFQKSIEYYLQKTQNKHIKHSPPPEIKMKLKKDSSTKDFNNNIELRIWLATTFSANLDYINPPK